MARRALACTNACASSYHPGVSVDLATIAAMLRELTPENRGRLAAMLLTDASAATPEDEPGAEHQ